MILGEQTFYGSCGKIYPITNQPLPKSNTTIDKTFSSTLGKSTLSKCFKDGAMVKTFIKPRMSMPNFIG